MFDSGMVDMTETVRQLAAVDVAAAPVGVVEERLSALARVRAWLDGVEARLVHRADELAAAGSGAGATGSLAVAGGCSSARARQVAARAATVDAAPELGEGLSAGVVSAEHVDAVGRAAKRLPEQRRGALFERAAELADAAATMAPDAFAKHVNRLAARLQVDEGQGRLAEQQKATELRSWSDRASGMLKVAGQLDPVLGARWLAGIAEETDRLAADGWARNHHTAAHAAVNLITRGRDRGPAQVVNELVLVIDADTLTSGLHDHSICETEHGTTLPPETLRQLTCSAAICAVVQDSRGVPIWAGVNARVANRAQRRALRSMYRTCAWAGCDRPFDWCQIHHIQPWEHGGLTELANLLPLCWEHHHAVHQGRWTIDLAPDRTLTIRRPDGHHHATVTLPTLPAVRDKHHHARRERQLARDRLTRHLARHRPRVPT